jgi:hypothetical protein
LQGTDPVLAHRADPRGDRRVSTSAGGDLLRVGLDSSVGLIV